MKLNLLLSLSLLVSMPLIAADQTVQSEEQIEQIETEETASPAEQQSNPQATQELKRVIMMGNFERTKKALADGADAQAMLIEDLTAEDLAALLVKAEPDNIKNIEFTYGADKLGAVVTGLSALTFIGACTTTLAALICGCLKAEVAGNAYSTAKAAGLVSAASFALVAGITVARSLYWRRPRERLKVLSLLSAFEQGTSVDQAAQAVEKKITLSETRDFYTNLAQLQEANEVLEEYLDDQE